MRRSALLIGLVGSLAIGGTAMGAATPQIVLLDPGSNAAAKATGEEQRGNDVTDVYSTAIDGFAAKLDPADIARLEADPSVISVEPDARVSINAAPVNDMFASPTVITGASGSLSGTTASSTREANEPTPLGNIYTTTAGVGRSIWYSWTAPATGSVVITTQGSGFDTMLGLYTGAALTGLTTVGANDDVGRTTTTRWSSVTAAVTGGTTYRIAIDGWNGASGSTKLNWTLTAGAPGNDGFANAATISGSQGTQTGTTANGSRETGEPTHGGTGGARSIWYRWTAPATGSVTFSTSGSAFSTLLGAYTGGSVGSLTTIATGSSVVGQNYRTMTFSATSGTTYLLAVDGASGASGSTSLGWNLTATSPTTAPGAPGWAIVPVTIGGSSITASLTAPASDGGSPITRYNVSCSGTGTTRTGTSTTTAVTVSSLTPGGSYTCTATATNAVGTSTSTGNSGTFVMPAVPGAPAGVTATPKNGGATIAWTAPVTGGSPITGYTATSSGSPARTCTTISATTCTITGLTNGVPYTFTVRATNAVGQGPASAASAPVTPAQPVLTPPADPTPAPTPAPVAPAPSQPTEPAPVTGPGLPQSRETTSWGLDRLDQRAGALDGLFSVPLDGTGVTAYVIDTGVLGDHEEFTGRVVAGVDGVGDGNGTGDCNGHGTHVAGTIAGRTMGVAPMARISPVRVLGCQGDGSVSDVIAGLDWIVRTHAAGAPAVANMSMGTPASTALNAAVDRAVADGVTVTVAAGNNAGDACDMSPASDGQAITVGATDDTDVRASFSNYGSCVTLFAPGVDIESAWHTGTKDTEVLSGTSMAAPHAAGVAALLLSGTPSALPGQVKQGMLDAATPGLLSNIGAGSPNLLLFAASSSVPMPSATRSGQSANQVTVPKIPKLKSAKRDKKGRVVLVVTADKNAIVKVFAGKRLLKTAKAPSTGKAFSITIAKAVKKGTKLTLKASNTAGSSKASKAFKAP